MVKPWSRHLPDWKTCTIHEYFYAILPYFYLVRSWWIFPRLEYAHITRIDHCLSWSIFANRQYDRKLEWKIEQLWPKVCVSRASFEWACCFSVPVNIIMIFFSVLTVLSRYLDFDFQKDFIPINLSTSKHCCWILGLTKRLYDICYISNYLERVVILGDCKLSNAIEYYIWLCFLKNHVFQDTKNRQTMPLGPILNAAKSEPRHDFKC